MRQLELRGISKSFSASDPPAVTEVSFAVERGDIFALLGPSGCGKTTTLRIIAGFERADRGEVILDASSVNALPPERRRVGLVFQDYALFPNRTVLGNVTFALRRLPRRQRRGRAIGLLQIVGLEREQGRMPGELSGGQQQRVAIARALAAEPEVLLLDEPFSNLDAALRDATRREVRSLLKSTGITTVFVTHDQAEALSFADRVGVMNEGAIEQIGTPEGIYMRPASAFVASFLGRANLLRGLAKGEVAETPLGVLPITPATQGSVLVALRPEHMTLRREGAPNATVISREFRGHDITYEVRTASGDYLAHTEYVSEFAPGEAVQLSAREPAVVLERGED
ncbi:MAG: ABC transporter ATP-binding protein [Spirochaetaceae bacterium]